MNSQESRYRVDFEEKISISKIYRWNLGEFVLF